MSDERWMMLYRNVFTKPHTFLAVVHVQDAELALRNVRIATEGGADGVFLVKHGPSGPGLDICYGAVREAFPDVWIGLNWLNLTNEDGLAMMGPSMQGMWVDHAGVHEDADRATVYAERFARLRREWEKKWRSPLILFGGAAFKYQDPVEDLGHVAALTAKYVDVVTTSGDGTGIAPDIGKLEIMKRAIDDHPLANASGTTSENVHAMKPFVDCFLVSTGISRINEGFPDELDPHRVRQLAEALAT